MGLYNHPIPGTRQVPSARQPGSPTSVASVSSSARMSCSSWPTKSRVAATSSPGERPPGCRLPAVRLAGPTGMIPGQEGVPSVRTRRVQRIRVAILPGRSWCGTFALMVTVVWRFPLLNVTHVMSSGAGVIGGTLPVGMADGADDEADAARSSPLRVSLRLTGIRRRAACQPQDPVLPAAAGEEPGSAAGDGGLPVDVGEFGGAAGDRGGGGDEAGEVVAVQPTGADDQVAGCFEGVEPAAPARQRQRVRVPRAGRWSWQVLLLIAAGTAAGDAGGQPGFLAEPGDLVVLGGDPGQGLARKPSAR